MPNENSTQETGKWEYTGSTSESVMLVEPKLKNRYEDTSNKRMQGTCMRLSSDLHWNK